MNLLSGVILKPANLKQLNILLGILGLKKRTYKILLKNIRRNNMYPTKEQLESKWWHRLIIVIIWFTAILIFFLTTFLLIDISGDYSLQVFLWALLIAPIPALSSYLVLRFTYWFITKIILYIAYGKKSKTE